MFDEDYEDDDGSPPLESIVESEIMDDRESVMEGRRRAQPPSPPQSIIDESAIIEEEEEELDHREGGVRNGNLSTVPEEEEVDETQRRELDSASFVSGAEAMNRINRNEIQRWKEDPFVMDDPRFNRTHQSKEHSWEPSPYNSRIEERGDEENRSMRGGSKSILPSTLDTSKSNRSANNRSVKFSEKTETRTLTPPCSSGSTTTIGRSDDPLSSPTKNTQGDRPLSPPSFETFPLPAAPVSPSESMISSTSSIYQSTPHDRRLSKKQQTTLLKDRFSDISAIEGTGNINHSGGFLLPDSARQTQRAPPPQAGANPADETLTTSDILHVVQNTERGYMMQALENARKQPKRNRRNDSSLTNRSTTSSRGGGGEVGTASSSASSSRQPSLTPLPSSTPINTSTSNRPLSTTFVTDSSVKSSGRKEDHRRQERQERLPDMTAPSSSRREVSTLNETAVSSRRDTSTRNEDYRRQERPARGEEYGRQERLPEIERRDENGREERERREYRPPSAPPRLPFRPTQMNGDVSRRRTDSNTSACSGVSGVSTRSSQSENERVESRADSQKSSHLRTLGSDQRELDFGFVEVGESKILTFKARSELDRPITCHFSLEEKSSKSAKTKKEPAFKILDGTEMTVEAGGWVIARVQFAPTELSKFTKRLIIQVSGGISQRFGINLMGQGGRSQLAIVKRSGLNQHRTGDYILLTESDGQISLGVENTGKRTMYVRAAVEDGYGRKMEGNIFSPSNSFVVQAGKVHILQLDVSRATVLDNNGRTSSLSYNGMGTRQSSSSSLNYSGNSACRGRSAPSYTIKLWWGEETSRLRMLEYCRSQSYTSFPPLCSMGEDFSTPFNGEQDYVVDRDRMPKKFDMEYFSSSMKLTNIYVHLNRRVSTPMDDDSDLDRTLMPDDTFRGNESIASVVPDLTMLKPRR